MAVKTALRPLKFYVYTCDFTSERSLSWGNNCLIFTKDNSKWWKISSGTFIEVPYQSFGIASGEVIRLEVAVHKDHREK